MKKRELCFLAVSFFASQCLWAEETVSVGVGTVSNDVEVIQRRYVGRVTPIESVSVIARVSGEIMEVGFSEGDRVSKGQVLYKLDDVRYAASVKAAEAAVAQCSAAAVYAKKTLDRVKTLFEKGVATSEELDSAVSSNDSAEAALHNAEANLVLAQDDLKHSVISSPIDGVISVNSFTTGNYVTPSSGALSSIVSTDPMRVRFSMSSRDVAVMFGTVDALKEGAELTLQTADGKEYPLKGKVEFVDNTANVNTDSIRIFGSFANPDGVLFPGAAVTVNVVRESTVSHPSVDATAVIYEEGGSYVYVVDNGNIASRRDVVLGATKGGRRFVESGLSAGERVVSLGTHKVYDGAKLEVTDVSVSK